MLDKINQPATLAVVADRISVAEMPDWRRRDLLSAIRRMAEMFKADPAAVRTDVADLRIRIGAIRPARHDISAKTFANLRSAFAATLEHVGILDPMERGGARRDPVWGLLLLPLPSPSRLGTGLAAFCNFCGAEGISPEEVDDDAVQRFFAWLESRTLHPDPRSTVRRVPRLWNEAARTVAGWPQRTLTCISFRKVSGNIRWADLPASFRADAEAYLEMRQEPDRLETSPSVPNRPLAPATLRQQREHIRLAASVLLREGMPSDGLASLTALVTADAFKAILRNYLRSAGGKPNAFVVTLAKTLIDIARFHAKVDEGHLTALKAIAGKLPAVPLELTEKNKFLLRELDNDRVKARLLDLPVRLLGRVQRDLEQSVVRFVEAQVAIAVDILLVAPLRPQNLIALDGNSHFQEPNGPKGNLVLHIPKNATKTGKRELVFELPADVSEHIRWYRMHILPRLGAGSHGRLFVTGSGKAKGQSCLTIQMIKVLEAEIGVRMTPHTFRHFSAMLFLEEHPEAFQVVSDLLGHAWAKTTRIYAGTSSRRASRAYGKIVQDKRNELLPRGRRPRKKGGGG